MSLFFVMKGSYFLLNAEYNLKHASRRFVSSFAKKKNNKKKNKFLSLPSQCVSASSDGPCKISLLSSGQTLFTYLCFSGFKAEEVFVV